MRIISGNFKGRKILPPKNLPVRPTTDMAKESLFNILNNHFYLNEVHVLDLFAGTGNISYEFASRGALSIVAVDKDFGCIQFINKVTDEFEMPIKAFKSNVFKYLEQTKVKSDIIFADPPYNFNDEQFLAIPDLVFNHELLTDKGVLVVEHSKHTNLSQHPNYRESRYYGGSTFSFFYP